MRRVTEVYKTYHIASARRKGNSIDHGSNGRLGLVSEHLDIIDNLCNKRKI